MPAHQREWHAVESAEFLSREELIAALVSYIPAVARGLCLIARSIPLGVGRTIDLMGVDSAGNPVLVVATTRRDEASFLEALDLGIWLERAKGLLRQLLPGSSAEGRPRLLFVAPEFSPRVLRLSDLIKRQGIELVRYRRIQVGEEAALLMENLTTGDAAAVPRIAALGTPRSSLVPASVDLTDQEFEELSRPLGLSRAEGR